MLHCTRRLQRPVESEGYLRSGWAQYSGFLSLLSFCPSLILIKYDGSGKEDHDGRIKKNIIAEAAWSMGDAVYSFFVRRQQRRILLASNSVFNWLAALILIDIPVVNGVENEEKQGISIMVLSLFFRCNRAIFYSAFFPY